MELPLVEKCGNCFFWRDAGIETRFTDQTAGFCRKRPHEYIGPQAGGRPEDEWAQPVTPSGEWCGEWNPKPTGKPFFADAVPPPDAGSATGG